MLSGLFKSSRVRNAFLQYGFLAVLLLLAVSVVWTARTNLAAQGMTTGFGFLERSTGWNIGFSLLSYGPSDSYLRALVVGLLNTIFLSAIVFPLATIIGIVVAVMRTSRQPIFELIGATYVEVFRNIPLLLQLLFWYTLLRGLPAPKQAIALGEAVFLTGRGLFLPWITSSGPAVIGAVLLVLLALGLSLAMRLNRKARLWDEGRKRMALLALWGATAALAGSLLWLTRAPGEPFVSLPQVQGLRFQGGLAISPELTACIIAISTYGGAFIAEIMRSGLQTVAIGHTEASRALGLNAWQIFTRIRFPLAIRAALPILANQYIWLTKSTTLGIAVGFADYYMVVSTAINQSGQTLELIGILMGGFLAINYALAFGFNRLNDAIRLKGKQARA